MADRFIQWLNGEIARRGWTLRELSRRSGLSCSTVSRVLSGTARPGWEFCAKAARALGVETEHLFRLAGLLPSRSEDTAALSEMNALFSQLTPEDQQRFLIFLRAYLESQSAGKGNLGSR